ncbi:hypothetical protein B0T22DRAFT_476134 [Podospora appendiculata]|uniref:Aminoglycoside phosphotransferase domain-containing protein n=1 Tax=Podospora appendiculata TaxID=314037 RepID=A0AAE0XHV9_9PEZI|nr:hypothetical protein B0T22DRAFT_476134 [Podospora appendiculata]
MARAGPRAQPQALPGNGSRPNTPQPRERVGAGHPGNAARDRDRSSDNEAAPPASRQPTAPYLTESTMPFSQSDRGGGSFSSQTKTADAAITGLLPAVRPASAETDGALSTSAMPAILEVQGHGPITTYKSASKEEFNVISRLAHGPSIRVLANGLWRQRASIEALTRQHLGLGSHDSCTVLDRGEWIRGGFNICVVLAIASGGRSSKVVFRCAMPYKLAEARYPGTVDEKLGCEAGAYVWMQERCPDIRIPHLYGFGYTDGRHFTHVRHRPVLSRISHMFWRCVYRLLKYPLLSQYVRIPTADHRVSSAYVLLEYIDPAIGRMLPNTWDKHRDDPARQHRLFQGMSKILFSLARLPQQRIGAFQFNNDGIITLSNRPLSCSIVLLENDGAPRTMEVNDTYTCTDAFASDTLTFHDNRFLSQPNAIYTEDDCRAQMAVKTLLRAFAHRHIKREYRCGPFLLQLTDFHASNMFVDDEWNITCLVDLEWLCALPPEMLSVPHRLTGCCVDEIEGELYDEFNKVREHFMRVFREQESRTKAEHEITISKLMQDMWDSKGVWFWYCLSSVNAMYMLLDSHLCPAGYFPSSAERAVS